MVETREMDSLHKNQPVEIMKQKEQESVFLEYGAENVCNIKTFQVP